MSLLFQLLAFAALLYGIILLGRMAIEWIQVLARGWRPRGLVLVLSNVIYALTDPPLRAIRRFIKPITLGAVSLDLGFLILFILMIFAQSIFIQLAVNLS